MHLSRGACVDGRVRGLRNKQWLEFPAVRFPKTPTFPRRNIDQARQSVLVLRKKQWPPFAMAPAKLRTCQYYALGSEGVICAIARQPPLFFADPGMGIFRVGSLM